MNLRRVTAPLIAAAFFICSALPAWAAPALWLVRGPVGKVYLFGTVHLLREGTAWRTPELEDAIAHSQDLYLEISNPMDKAAMGGIVQLGMDREHPLSTKLPKDDLALLDEAAKKNGLPGEAAFEPMRPWLVYLMLSMMPAMHSGYAAASGVDLQLRKQFVDEAKPVLGLETMDMQMHLFADIPEKTQIAMLESQLKTHSTTPQGTVGLDSLVDIWLSGDEDRLASAMQIDSYRDTSFYNDFIVKRNKAWAAALSERLKQPGTSFVSVGAAHLAGPNGVPALLAQMGYTVTRVPIAETPAPSSSPSPAPSAPASSQAQATATPAASPAPAPTPIPQTVTPPAGWQRQANPPASAGLKIDTMWMDPKRQGVIMAGHFDVPGMQALDLDTLDSLMHQGMISAAGSNGVGASKHVKLCGGKQEGTYTVVTLNKVKEDVVLAVSDRGYLAQYVRRADVANDPAAMKAILSLCAP